MTIRLGLAAKVWALGFWPIALAPLIFLPGDGFLQFEGFLLLYVIGLSVLSDPRGLGFSPLVVFSAIYTGFVLGAFYYSTPEHIEKGKFFVMADVSVEAAQQGLIWAMLWCIAAYAFFAVGYYAGGRSGPFGPVKRIADLSPSFQSSFRNVAPLAIGLFLTLGGGYWIYLAHVLAGGVVEMLFKFGAFVHMIAGRGVTTLPFHLFYAGVNAWAMLLIIENKRIPLVFYAFATFAMALVISTGRISSGIAYVLALFLLFFFARRDAISAKHVWLTVFALTSIAFLLLFLRISSSYYYIEQDPTSYIANANDGVFELFAKIIVGWGNVADLQQVVLILKTWGISESLWGVTYFDAFRNMFAGFLDVEPTSVGLRLKENYFPTQRGGPTPSAVGEAWVNFNFGGLIFMALVGFFFARSYEYAMTTTNVVVLFLYAQFLSRFVLLYPKVDSTVLASFLWGSVPTLLFLAIVWLLKISAKDLGRSRGPLKTPAEQAHER